jgi:hypothetical protein
MIKKLVLLSTMALFTSNMHAGCYETAQTGWSVGLGVRKGAMNEQHAINMCKTQISIFKGEEDALQIAFEACIAAATGGTLTQVIMKNCH